MSIDSTTTEAFNGCSPTGYTTSRKRYSAHGTLSEGWNTIEGEYCTANGCASQTINVHYQGPYGLVITPDGASTSVVRGSGGSYNFTVQNTGASNQTVDLTVTCGSAVTCTGNNESVNVNANSSVTKTVYYTGVTETSATVTLSGQVQQNGSITESGSVVVYVQPKPISYVTIARTAGGSTIGVGQTASYTARTYAADDEELTGRTVTWSSAYVSLSSSSGSSAASTTATGSSAGSGYVQATSEGVSSSSSGLTVVNPSYGVSISSDRSTTITPSAGATSTGTTTYTITNTSTYTDPTPTFSLSATPTGVIGSCSVSPTSVNVAPGATSGSITVSCPIGATTSSSSPTVTFAASTTSPSSFSNNHVTTFNVSPNYAVAVSTPSGSSKTEAAQTTSSSATFRITNNSSNVGGSTTFAFSVSCSYVTSCSTPSNTAVSEGSYSDVTVNYGVPIVGTSGGSVQLTATVSGRSETSNNTITVATTPYSGGITVSGISDQTIPVNSGSGVSKFTVRNNNKNTGSVSFSLSSYCPLNLTYATCSVSSTNPISLTDQQTSDTVTISYSIDKSYTFGTARLTAASSSPSASNNYTTNLNATAVHKVATLALAYPDKYLDVSRCVADCFEVTHAFTGPSYTSLGVTRAASFVYRSGRATRLATIQLSVVDSSDTAATVMSLRLQRPDQSFVTFTNGTSTLFFRPGTSHAAMRMAAQFDVSSLSSGSYEYEAIVKSWWADGQSRETQAAARFFVVNGSESNFGFGWTLAQEQRGYVQEDGMMIADGSGSATFYGYCGSAPCTMIKPNGEASNLYYVNSSSYRRDYLDGTSVYFDGTGVMLSVHDRLGNVDSLVRDGYGKVTGLRDPIGYSITLGYDGNGKLSSVTAPVTSGSARADSVTVNGSGDLTQVKNADGIINFIATYAGHALTNVHDRRGGDWASFYAGVDSTIDSLRTPGIDSSGTTIYPRSQFFGPVRSVLASIDAGNGTDSAHAIANNLDLRAWTKNPRNYKTYFTLGIWGSPTKVDYVDGASDSSTYDTNGLLTRTQSADGQISNLTWNGYLVTKVVQANRPDSVRTHYTTYARPDSIIGVVTKLLTYNDGAKSYSIRTDSLADTVTHYYDSFGRDTMISDAGKHDTKVRFLSSGFRNADYTERPGYPSNSRVYFHYDPFGRQVAVVYPDSSRDSTVYDGIDRVTQTIDVHGNITSYAFDSLYLRSVTDARGKTTTFTTNPIGWVTSESRAGSGGPIASTYDRNGNILSVTNRRAQAVTFKYDSLDQMVRRGTAEGDSALFTYKRGSVSTKAALYARNAESRDSVTFDLGGRLDSILTRRDSGTYAIRYEYDSKSRVSKVSALSSHWANDKYTGYTYKSKSGGVDSVKVATGGDTKAYRMRNSDDMEGLPDTISYAPGYQLIQKFTSLHTPYNRKWSVSALNAKLGTFTSLDPSGRLAMRSNTAQDTVRMFSYDSLGRLSVDQTWQFTTPTCTPHTAIGVGCAATDTTMIDSTAFSYDLAGNLLNGVTSMSSEGNRILVKNGVTYTYDDDGNLKTRTSGGNTDTLFWNSLGQLTKVRKANGDSIRFGYDAFGNRVRKSVNANDTTFLVNNGDVWLVLNAGGNPVVEYSYWGTDNLISMYKGGNTYYFDQDPVGQSVRGLIRHSDTVVVAKYEYDAFGNIRSSFDSVANNRLFAGREYDAETGLYYNRARYYDPALARFISEDPIGVAGGLNLYAYAGNDPINSGDPSGLKTKEADTCVRYKFVGGWFLEDLSDGVLEFKKEPCLGPGSAGAPEIPEKPKQGEPVSPPPGGGAGKSKLPPARPIPVGELPMCTSAKFAGNTGVIDVQLDPKSGFLQWGVTMFNPAVRSSPGVWLFQEFVGGRAVSGEMKPNEGMLHGSVNPTKLKSGEIFTLSVIYRDAFGLTHHSVKNGCLIP